LRIVVVFEERDEPPPRANDPLIPQPGDRQALRLDQHDGRLVLAEVLARRAGDRLDDNDLDPVALGQGVDRTEGRSQHVPAVDRRDDDAQLGGRGRLNFVSAAGVGRDGLRHRASFPALFLRFTSPFLW
jgi:hypothetical protein